VNKYAKTKDCGDCRQHQMKYSSRLVEHLTVIKAQTHTHLFLPGESRNEL